MADSTGCNDTNLAANPVYVALNCPKMSIPLAKKPSVHMLSADHRTALVAELNAWKTKFGAKAQAQGLLPPPSNSSSIDEDHLQRWLDNKIAVEEASKNNPHAAFDLNNKFALMTEAEFAAYVQGSFEQGNESQRYLTEASIVASSIDWTTGICMPPVRDQGQCGSCWAFAATGVAEMGHCIATGHLLDLSEQQVTSCSTNGGSQGCDGGFSWYAIDYASQTGLCLDSAWPYLSGTSSNTGTCNNQCTKKTLAIGTSVRVSGENALATALNKQPVSVTVTAGNAVWQHYTGGVVTQCPSVTSDHAVIAVGYDGQSYKLRNSWGAGWGEGGYIRVQRGVGGVGMCNVVGAVSFPQVTAKSPCDIADGHTVTLQADTINYLTHCWDCIPGELFPDSATLHVSDSNSRFVKWKVFNTGTGKLVFQAETGNYLARCSGCTPNSKVTDQAFVHVPDWHGQPWAQWTCVDIGGGKIALQADSGNFLSRCSLCEVGAKVTDTATVHMTTWENAPYAQWKLLDVTP
ncbi:Aste57867_13046 [Aphanomyces stellatus]|uniref:Aste57867_13046 protein n=1 Tax=Aphanomyces stellatus TaxID=120398 RepID=A0A485KX54_9STRA|nr:hypothetical protein As57867_012998 [Aphanomyces stellatus]VFT89891.1 Aste57867_13046 [Aphanomyces stellatus]